MTTAELDFEALTKGLITKSDKIRSLARAGASTAAIAKFLDIRYQFARNVLVDAGLNGNKLVDASKPQSPPVRRPEQMREDGWLQLSADGSLILPAPMMAKLGMKPGAAVLVRKADDCLEILSQEAGLARVHKMVRQYVPQGASLVDELIADRKAAAQDEGH